MTHISVDNFEKEVVCFYHGEKYSVRDNGAVYKHIRAGKKKRPTDAMWTFGKPCDRTGYMYIASIRIHRIVATAFHGEPPNWDYVVDHIDTNRRNNRPKNLRWLTRLENILKNEITRRRIEAICGSVEAFLKDPSVLGSSKLDPNFSWMRTVSKEEAAACRERLDQWAKSDTPLSGGTLGEWVYKPIMKTKRSSDTLASKIQPAPPRDMSTTLVRAAQKAHELSNLIMAITPGAMQRNWKIPSEFPCCPTEKKPFPLKSYAEKLTHGVTFSRNKVTSSSVVEVAVAEDFQAIWLVCKNEEEAPVKPWSVAEITYEEGFYVHKSLKAYFDRDGAQKAFVLAQGLKWDGGDTFDDYC